MILRDYRSYFCHDRFSCHRPLVLFTAIMSVVCILICTGCTEEIYAGSAGSNDLSCENTACEPAIPNNPDVPTEPAEPINLPACDPANPEVRFIVESNDWADINNPAYRIFCVYPGDYTDRAEIHITADGEPGNERWIRLYDPLTPNDDSIHPVAVDDTQRAVVSKLVFGFEGDPANYWYVDRITKRGTGPVLLDEGSERIVFNRMLLEQGEGDLFTVMSAKDVTLQNSVLRQTEVLPDSDRHCIHIGSSNIGTRIINNEIYDCAGDGLQFGPDATGGAIISSNDFYVTPALYTDCQGNRDSNGSCACAENAIDMKGPGGRLFFQIEQDDLVRIEGNRMWGFRPTDTNCGGTGSAGSAVVIGSGGNYVNFVQISSNIIMDGPDGINIVSTSVDHISIIGNLIYGMTKTLPGVQLGAIKNMNGSAVEIYLNTIINNNYWLQIGADVEQNDVRCNVVIDGNARPSSSQIYGVGSTVDYNFFYNTEEYTTEADQGHDLVFDSAAESLQGEYCYYRRQMTGQEQVCIPYGMVSDASPHRYACDSGLGQRTEIGVSDATAFDIGIWGI